MLLTIGIPTLNEERHIKDTLFSIIRESISSSLNIEVIVIDNASEDETISEVNSTKNEFIENGISLRVQQNLENMGFSFSCDELIRESLGDYILILGAHDQLLPGSLTRIKNCLEKFRPLQIILNASVKDEKTNTLLNPSIYNFKNEVVKEGIWTVSEKELFFSEMFGPCRAISLNIFKCSELKYVLDEPLDTKYWGFYQRFIDAITKSQLATFCFLEAPNIEILLKFDGWQYSTDDTFGSIKVRNSHTGYFADMDLARLVATRFTTYPWIWKNVGLWLNTFTIPRTIFCNKFTGMKTTPKILTLSIKSFNKSLWFWTLGLPILLFPSVVCRPEILTGLRKLSAFLRSRKRA